MIQLDYISAPSPAIKGTMTVPGDKSISHRAIMFGAIAEGTTTISGFLDGADCMATLEAFRSMGVIIEGPVDQSVVIHGAGNKGLNAPSRMIDCGNSGTTIRLMSGLLVGQEFDSELTGDKSLLKRPMGRISKPLTLMGAKIITCDGHPPIFIEGRQALTGITYDMPVASAQVKSAILLAGMQAEGETRVIESSVTRDHTERMLTTFSYPIQKMDNAIIINGGGTCIATDIIIPGDISSAAFFIAAASIIPGSDILIRNVGVNPTRTGVLDILLKMGANIKLINKRLCGEEPVADISVKYSPLEGIDIPSSLVPLAIDEFPIIFIAAACAKGQTLLHGARELRVKESDRIGVMADGLKRLGIEVQTFDDGLFINGGLLQGGEVNSAHDHRIAMAFAIAGAVAAEPILIRDCVNIQTSFPGFLETAQNLGLLMRKKTNE